LGDWKAICFLTIPKVHFWGLSLIWRNAAKNGHLKIQTIVVTVLVVVLFIAAEAVAVLIDMQ